MAAEITDVKNEVNKSYENCNFSFKFMPNINVKEHIYLYKGWSQHYFYYYYQIPEIYSLDKYCQKQSQHIYRFILSCQRTSPSPRTIIKIWKGHAAVLFLHYNEHSSVNTELHPWARSVTSARQGATLNILKCSHRVIQDKLHRLCPLWWRDTQTELHCQITSL